MMSMPWKKYMDKIFLSSIIPDIGRKYVPFLRNTESCYKAWDRKTDRLVAAFTHSEKGVRLLQYNKRVSFLPDTMPGWDSLGLFLGIRDFRSHVKT